LSIGEVWEKTFKWGVLSQCGKGMLFGTGKDAVKWVRTEKEREFKPCSAGGLKKVLLG